MIQNKANEQGLQIEFLTEQMVLDSSTDKHCMLGMHHMKALDALFLLRAYGGRSRHHGSIQLVGALSYQF